MHSHLTTHLVTAKRAEAELARPSHRVQRRAARKIALKLPHRHTVARRGAIRPA